MLAACTGWERWLFWVFDLPAIALFIVANIYFAKARRTLRDIRKIHDDCAAIQAEHFIR